ncbi:hypothetical protein VUJ46_20360 [Chryseobacterium sp. MYb264]|uniref:hypothetical protein n=1 Tax=Chryseobacterium sp. MYb264 TaxID=2745153 RepID=UPI002E0E8396|nr:hypothetical protein VUJ46_20360 [Chryseobacterium sp. MYb264]
MIKILYEFIFNNFVKYWPIIIYFFINALFILKYGESYNIPLLIAYFTGILVIVKFYNKTDFKESAYKILFWSLGILFFCGSVGVNYVIDGKSLNVDRWDAMEIGIKAILNNEYPYSIKDYMGRESSNLPFLIILGMPFYLLFGSVGYLQCFCFLLFLYIIFKIFKDYKQRLIILIFLAFSPSYLWEIYTKSDLFSNFIILVALIYLIQKNFVEKKNLNIITVSILISLMVLTRFSVIIPLILLFFRPFFKLSIKDKLLFVLSSVITISSVLYLFFHQAESLDLFVKHNPLIIQAGKQPVIVTALYIITALILSFKVKLLQHIILWGGGILFICILLTFSYYMVVLGYENMITNSNFDISFFNMSMPFIVIAMGMKVFINLKSQRQ